jgi:hypothetical protein
LHFGPVVREQTRVEEDEVESNGGEGRVGSELLHDFDTLDELPADRSRDRRDFEVILSSWTPMHAVQRLPLERRRCLRSVQQATVNRGERDAWRVNPAAASVEGGGAVCTGPPCAAGLRRTAWDGALRERRDVGRVVQGQRDDRWERDAPCE